MLYKCHDIISIYEVLPHIRMQYITKMVFSSVHGQIFLHDPVHKDVPSRNGRWWILVPNFLDIIPNLFLISDLPTGTSIQNNDVALGHGREHCDIIVVEVRWICWLRFPSPPPHFELCFKKLVTTLLLLLPIWSKIITLKDRLVSKIIYLSRDKLFHGWEYLILKEKLKGELRIVRASHWLSGDIGIDNIQITCFAIWWHWNRPDTNHLLHIPPGHRTSLSFGWTSWPDSWYRHWDIPQPPYNFRLGTQTVQWPP